MSSLFDLVEEIGLDAIDAEVNVWIEQGIYDPEVLTRAKELGTIESPAADWHQKTHRLVHPDGPFGYEYCAACILALGL